MPTFAALISGLLAALAFPTIIGGFHFPDLSYLAWIALIPYFLVLRDGSPRRIAVLTFLMSSLWNGLTSYWIFSALYFNGQLSAPGSLGVLAFMALTMGAIHALFMTAGYILGRRFRIPFILILPAAWTLYEWTRNYAPFGGYPWANLGYTQAPQLTLMQSADLFGVYGLCFLVVLVNVALAEALLERRKRKTLFSAPLLTASVLVLAFLGYGKWRLNQMGDSLKLAPSLAVGLLQPNIGQQMKWKTDLHDYIQELLIKMTREATTQGAKFVVWPESSLPTAMPMNLQEFAPLNHFSVPVLMGVLSTEPGASTQRPILYNSALQVDPGGHFAGRIHKQHLVPLGEYVPLQKFLWFLSPIVTKIGDFRTQVPKELLVAQGNPYGVVICYEDLFPEIARQFTRMGAAFLVNISNDAWYGDSSQLEQHLNFSKFRAVENRRSVLRATNNGHSATVDPTGRIHAEIPKFISGILLTEIPLQSGFSAYARFGDTLWITLLALALASAFILSRRGKPSLT